MPGETRCATYRTKSPGYSTPPPVGVVLWSAGGTPQPLYNRALSAASLALSLGLYIYIGGSIGPSLQQGGTSPPSPRAYPISLSRYASLPVRVCELVCGWPMPTAAPEPGAVPPSGLRPAHSAARP
jgi:hypothetical protein